MFCGLSEFQLFAMESEVGSTNQLIFETRNPGGWKYLTSCPGILRSLNVAFGLLTLTLILLGFANDFPDESFDETYERRRKSKYRFTYDGRFTSYDWYYGYGYASEGPNVVQLICVVLSLAFSVFFLLILVCSPECHATSRAWNRFLNLSAAILHCVGLMNGISGLLAFRSYCCHVEFGSNERHKSEFQGYFRNLCVCYFTPTWETSWKEYTTLYYNDVPDDMEFRGILPHHFVPHAIALCVMSINMATYLAASLKI